MPKTYIEICCTYLHETDDAVLVDLAYGDRTWIPKSQIADWPHYEHNRGDDIEVDVEVWFAEQEGLV